MFKYVVLVVVGVGCGGSPRIEPSPGSDAAAGQIDAAAGQIDAASESPSRTSDAALSDAESSVPIDGSAAGPNILSFGTDVTTLNVNQFVRVVAIVTHPEGLDHLVGGRLTDPTGTVSYDAFTADRQGSYAITTTWNQLNQVSPITFVDSSTRTLVGEFYDQAGHTTSRSVTLTLTCNGVDACSGQCFDLDTDPNNCGQCGNKLPDFKRCVNGVGIVPWQECLSSNFAPTCSQWCARSGSRCDAQCGINGTQSRRVYSGGTCTPPAVEEATTCDAPLVAGLNYGCCCVP
jgi:hypothetical protein